MILDLVLSAAEKQKIFQMFFQKLLWKRTYKVGDWVIIHLKKGEKYHHIGEAEVIDVKVTTLFKLPVQTAYMTLGMEIHEYLINHYQEHLDIIDDLEKHEVYIYLFKIIHRKEIFDDELRIYVQGY